MSLKFTVTLRRFSTFGSAGRRTGDDSLYHQIDGLRKAGHPVVLELETTSHLSETMHWLSVLFDARFTTSKEDHEDARALVSAHIDAIEVVE